MSETWDVIVIGGGTAGCGAAIYSARFNLKTLIITKEKSGLIATTHIVENYPGIKSAAGPEFMDMFYDHVNYYNIPIKEEEVLSIKKTGKLFSVKTESSEYKAKTLIYTAGSSRRKLNVPGEKEFSSKGVSYCSTCDAPLFKNKIVGVVGGSDSAAKEALFAIRHVKKAYIIYRGGKIHPEPINMNLVEEEIKKGKIEIINNTNVVQIKGDKFVTHLILDNPYKGKKEFPLDGLFIEIGSIPITEPIKGLGVKLNKKGEIVIDRHGRTNVPGFYSAGDVTDDPFKQVITGVGEAVACAFSAFDDIRKGNL